MAVEERLLWASFRSHLINDPVPLMNRNPQLMHTGEHKNLGRSPPLPPVLRFRQKGRLFILMLIPREQQPPIFSCVIADSNPHLLLRLPDHGAESVVQAMPITRLGLDLKPFTMGPISHIMTRYRPANLLLLRFREKGPQGQLPRQPVEAIFPGSRIGRLPDTINFANPGSLPVMEDLTSADSP